MARESFEKKRARFLRVLEQLQKTYPDAHCELAHSNPLELLIATILSAQCSDKQVNRVTEGLFRAYRTARDYEKADLADLENQLRSLGLFRNKAKNIQACCRILEEKFGGTPPAVMESLTSLPGVGRKTANVVLGNAFGLQHGIVVDTHVSRLAQRLGFTREQDPEKIERELQKLAPQEHWTLVSHWLIWHGRRRCFARKPDCRNCELRELCPSAKEWL